MTPTTTHPTVRVGALVGFTKDNHRIGGEVTTDQALITDEVPGLFVINTGRGKEYPHYTFGLLTGRTVRMYGMDCPTIDRFEVDTVVRPVMIDGFESFALWGVPGARITGTMFTRPENIVTV